MSVFDQQLEAARKRQYLFYIGMAVLFVISLCVLAAFILTSRATRIEVQPQEAALQAHVEVGSGLAFIISHTVYSLSSEVAITAVAEGFYSHTEMISNDDFGQVVPLVLRPLPARIRIDTNIDDDIQWSINGKVLMVSMSLEHQLAAGDYELMASHDHYQPQTLALSLQRGQSVQQTLIMESIVGTLQIKTTPSVVKISVDGTEVGISPLTVSLIGGYHTVTVRRSQYEPIEDVIEISRNQSDIQRDYQLEVEKTTVRVTLIPTGGNLRLNGIVVNNPSRMRVAAGVNHRLSYSSPGYFAEHKTFSVVAGEPSQLSFELKQEFGVVDLSSLPPAEVEIDGRLLGVTPLQVSLPAVAQQLVFKKPGFRSVTRTVTPGADGVRQIMVSLLPEQEARRAEAARQYVTKVGGMLKLFVPDDTFTMGADRSDRGQRANEFVRTVKLSRPFYAGVYEVTYAEYQYYDKSKKGHEKEPVTSVSWLNAVAFCNWLSELEGLTPVYDISNQHLRGVNINADGYRLLTEAEWEWLARKAGKVEQTIFVWGNAHVIPEKAVNIADEAAKGQVQLFVPRYRDGYQSVAPVGSLPKESSGLYDQGGNVSEWVHDAYSLFAPEKGKIFHDPLVLAKSNSHVIKGANWRSGSLTELRAAFRNGLNDQRDDVGFRIGRYVGGGN